MRNIKKEHVLKSIERIDEEGYPKKRQSKSFELVYKERCYPPKYVIALAGFFADQHFILHSEFSGGEYYNQFLRDFGFEVLTKEEAKAYPQAKENEKNIHYKYTYQNAISKEKLINNSSMNHSLNTILYGPPGTGKTYHTVNHSIAIIEEKTLSEIEQEDRDVLLSRYRDYLKQGLIVFTTFHQSMSYEDFVEGIKPIIKESEVEEGETLMYEIQDGIFKEIIEKVNNAQDFVKSNKESLFIPKEKFGLLINKVSLGNVNLSEDDSIYEYCLENDCIAIGFNAEIDFTGVNNRLDIINKYKDAEVKADFGVEAMHRFIHWMKIGQLVFIPNGNLKLRAIGEVVGEYEYNPNSPIRYSHFRKVKWLYKDLEIPIRDIYSKQFSQQTIYQIYSNQIDTKLFSKNGASKFQKNVNHVLIIDEINRGNVSQIFGELITLIEEDKRQGAKEEITVKLPYSKQNFSVPKNLYIIGTMNTADRSVEALDSALRRRFSFEEVPSNPKVIQKAVEQGIGKSTIEGIDLISLLEAINSRIEQLLDKDHAIGHSYFININNKAELVKTFEEKVIPLLEEYFFGDLGKIGLVLGDSFVQKSTSSKYPLMAFSVYDDRRREDLSQKEIYKIKDASQWNFELVYAK